ncbi:TPA: MurR/RpiR family transcriptional regulator [Streptococcus suis]
MQNIFLKKTIKDSRNKLSELEIQLSEYLLGLGGEELINKTISDMAEESDISQSTIYNFVKKIGFSGFKDFKLQLAQNISFDSGSSSSGIITNSSVTREDLLMDIAKKVISFNQSAFDSLLYFLDEEALSNIMLDMENAKSLNFFGQGGSSVVAFDAYQKFMRTKYWCNYDIDYHIQLEKCVKLSKTDVCFLFSHSGETKETITIARLLKERGCKLISITGNPNSELISLCDHSIIVYTNEARFRTESLTSRILYLTIIDIIYTCVMIRNEEENSLTLKKIRQIMKDVKN